MMNRFATSKDLPTSLDRAISAWCVRERTAKPCDPKTVNGLAILRDNRAYDKLTD